MFGFFLFAFNFLKIGLSLRRNTINTPFKRGCLVAQLSFNKVKKLDSAKNVKVGLCNFTDTHSLTKVDQYLALGSTA